MKSRITMWVLSILLVAGSSTTLQVTAQTNLSPSVVEVVKLLDAGVQEPVLLDYIRKSPNAFPLSADEIIYLRDLGISSSVISAMLQHEVDSSQQNVATPSNEQTPPDAAEVAGPVSNFSPSNTDAIAATNLNAPVSYVTNAPPEVQYFFDALAPYGKWIFIEDQGWAWQPNIVATRPDWQPYRDDGHWVWTDAGWFWASDYSWGWAPFHYGRWWLAPQWGWVWFPDTTWAPSWVTWRTYDNYYGWAPLPPAAVFTDAGFRFHHAFVGLDFDFGLHPDCFTFVESRHIFFHDFHHRNLPRERVHQFFKECQVVNNFAFDRHKRIINRGIDVDHVARFTGKRIDTARVVDAPKGSTHFHQPRHIVRNGKTVEVFRTPLPTTAPPWTMTRVPTKEAHNLNTSGVQPSTPKFTPPSGLPNRSDLVRPGERERRADVPAGHSHRTETVNPPEIRERAGTPVMTSERKSAIQPQAPFPQVVPINPPVERFNQPVERFNQPIERFNQPVERFNQPVERFNPPVESFHQPVERFNQPIERINPPVQQSMPQPSVPQRRIENVHPGNAPLLRQSPAIPPRSQGMPPSQPGRSSHERHGRGRP